MFLYINDKQFERIITLMSKFLDNFRAALEKVAQGNADDAETKAAVVALQEQLASNEATDEEQSTAILELTNKLAASTPPVA